MKKGVALVTGGARGIGRAIALDLVRDHRVFVTHLTSSTDNLPEGVSAIAADFRKPHAAAEAVTHVAQAAGRLDVIVHNAGNVSTSPLDASDRQAQHDMFDVNLFAAHDLLAAGLPHLKPGASIVAISSMNAVLPPRDAVLYGASKAALDLWVRGAAKELGPKGIRVNAVAPGAINSADRPRSDELNGIFLQNTALGRLGEPEDIANVVRFLVSPAAGFITGEVIAVSGGYRL